MLDDATTATTPTDVGEPDSGEVSEDTIARMKSLQWFSSGRPGDDPWEFEGMHVAILGEEILDTDRDVEELGRRIDARGDTIPQARVIFHYVPTRLEWLLYFSK